MKQIIIRETINTDKSKIVELSKHWETENITYGYIACSEELLDKYRIWIVNEEDTAIGFLFGKREVSVGMCVLPKDAPYFEIEDFYLLPEFRNKGIGTMLFEHVETQLKSENIKYILLSTATKDYSKILKFYTEKVGLTVWSTTLFKQI